MQSIKTVLVDAQNNRSIEEVFIPSEQDYVLYTNRQNISQPVKYGRLERNIHRVANEASRVAELEAQIEALTLQRVKDAKRIRTQQNQVNALQKSEELARRECKAKIKEINSELSQEISNRKTAELKTKQLEYQLQSQAQFIENQAVLLQQMAINTNSFAKTSATIQQSV